MSEDAVKIAARFVAPFEGFRSKPYLDVAGVKTIGYGETDAALIAKYRNGITEPEARALLEDRLGVFAAQVNRLVKVKLSAKQRAALYSFAYNLGTGALQSSTLLKYVNASRMAKAANEFPKWDRAGGQELEGLRRRRLAERKLWLEGSNHWTRIYAGVISK